MKRFLLLTLLFGCSWLFALSGEGDALSNRSMSTKSHNAGSMSLEVTNMGFYQNLVYPSYSGNSYLYSGASWISAKKHRRDTEGRKLYWVALQPSADSTQTTFEGSDIWHPDMLAVVDTLTSIGFDGDRDLYELLPAYNPLVAGATPSNPYYNEYNISDVVLTSILGSPAPRAFSYPDPLETYCFSIPQQGTFPTPGFETNSAYFYDFCPFVSIGERDLGASRNSNQHCSLGLALHRQSYAWNVQNLDRMIVFKTTIYNAGTQDTLFDLSIAEFLDADVIPYGSSIEGASDDLSGYVKGAGYEFAYSRDADFDTGLSPAYLANKIIVPDIPLDHSCWTWRLGDGPDDFTPLSFNFNPRRTANEKYWLMTGRNPNEYKFSNLRPLQDSQTEYEETVARDTRFLNSVCGAIPSTTDPNPEGRLNLAPGASLSYYSVLFMGNSLDELKQRAQSIESFIAGGLQIGDTTGLTCFPYLMNLGYLQPDTFSLSWHSYTDPDHFEVKYKTYNAPAAQWNAISLPGTSRRFDLEEMDSDTWYQIKVASIYTPGANEVYLESSTLLANLSYPSSSEENTHPPSMNLTNYPNPFNPFTFISFDLASAGYTHLAVYNSKGQKLRPLIQRDMPQGKLTAYWDGRDDSGAICPSGIYFLRLISGQQRQNRKMLLLK